MTTAEDGVERTTCTAPVATALFGATPGMRTVGCIEFFVSCNLMTRAAVVRNSLDGQGIGVEFLDLDPLDQARIQTFVEHQTPDGSA